jgi:hypothetical protein
MVTEAYFESLIHLVFPEEQELRRTQHLDSPEMEKGLDQNKRSLGDVLDGTEAFELSHAGGEFSHILSAGTTREDEGEPNHTQARSEPSLTKR